MNGIPTVIPGWIDYGWGLENEELGGLHLARSFGEIRSVLQSWISRPPLVDARNPSFVLPPGEGLGELRKRIARLVGRGTHSR